MENPPLQRVLIDLQYPVSPRLIMLEGLTEIQGCLRPDFPVMRPIAAPSFTISFGPSPTPTEPALMARYQFANEAGYDVQMGATNATISIPGSSYKERVHLATLLERVATAVGQVGGMSQYDRIGVRYINAAPATPSEWVRWFKPEFTGWTESGIVDEHAQRVAMLITQLAMPEADVVTGATIRHGYLPQGLGSDLTTSEAATKPCFLLDIDMATDKPGPFDPQSISTIFRAINREIAQYLRYTFTAEGETQFGVQTLPQEETT
jgi:uncharacterized protein (TIGR04255 family)